VTIVDEIYSSNSGRNFSYGNERKRPIISLRDEIIHCNRIGRKATIFEFKRSSASGFKNANYTDPKEFAAASKEYCNAFSLLTEPQYFGGKFEDSQAFMGLNKPLLMKDFIDRKIMIDKAYFENFDCILLISDFLSIDQVKELSDYAQSLALDVLVEFHDKDRFDLIKSLNRVIIGYNRRNLKTLKMEGEEEMINNLIDETENPFILESGINGENFQSISELNFDGYLIGEAVLKDRKFLREIKNPGVIKYDGSRSYN
jgi:indole-3-glycerol phosphate synthase